MATSEDFLAPEARIAFAQDLFKAKDNNGKMQFQATLLYPKTGDMKWLVDAVVALAVEEWGDKARQMLKDDLIKVPVLDGDGKQGMNKTTGERYEGFAGHNFIRVQSGADYPPLIVDQRLVPIVSAKGGLKSGDYGNPVVRLFTWENKENGKGVSVSISQLQKTRDGESLGGAGGAPDPDKFFKKLDVEAAGEETKGGDGAKGLFS